MKQLKGIMFLKKDLSLTFTVKACWEKLLFYKSKVWSPVDRGCVNGENVAERVRCKSIIPVYSMTWGQNALSHVQTTFRMARFSKNATQNRLLAAWRGKNKRSTKALDKPLRALNQKKNLTHFPRGWGFTILKLASGNSHPRIILGVSEECL